MFHAVTATATLLKVKFVCMHVECCQGLLPVVCCRNLHLLHSQGEKLNVAFRPRLNQIFITLKRTQIVNSNKVHV